MNEKKGLIFEIEKMSTEDGPGIRTTVFFKMCPLRCRWCHNPESLFRKPTIMWYAAKCIGCKTCLEVCPEDALTMDAEGIHINREKCIACGKCVDECPGTALRKLGQWWTLDDLIEEVAKDRTYYTKSGGGITASGGAAAVQSEFVTEFLKRCKHEGFHTALDICGILPKTKYEPMLPYVDLYLYDIKEIDPEKHKEFTGMSNEIILDNLVWLMNEVPQHNPNAKIWIRTPLIPGYTATKENILGIGKFIVEKLNNQVERWDLLAFNNLAKDKYQRMDMNWELKDANLFTKREMEDFLRIAQSTGVKNIRWSGLTKKIERKDVGI
ncbi:MAG: glycyl-radical enzyme activating protein [Candidatus Lokiarchaeota archaeon]|nr:glycyl-radical enzyme activating protein [Candidatus Lokiarchaeota archaeon]